MKSIMLNQETIEDIKKTRKDLDQAIYEIMLLDDRLDCTCDESYREDKIFQAKGHYHQCKLYQVGRAIEICLKFLPQEVSRKDEKCQ